jgi:antitoxin component YwqK of YwqJK toxin-antitoxin module
MKNIFFLILMAAVPLMGQAQFNQTNTKGQKHGEWRKNYPNSKQLRYKGQFENGVEIGTFIYYHENGRVQTENTYRGKSRICYSKHYSDKGVLIAEGLYAKNERDSTWRFYSDALGILISEETFQKGKRNGQVITYFKDGKVAERTTYVMDVKQGQWEQNFEDGQPKVRGNYVNNQLEGEVTYFSDISGKQMAKGHYKAGLRDGVWIFWDENGRPTRRETYEKGILKKTSPY